MFSHKHNQPMLIGAEAQPFDDDDYIFELKFDGVRALAYLDDKGCELRNKRQLGVSALYPELATLHEQVKERALLDGEIVALSSGKPDFFEIQRRALMSNPFKIRLAAARQPVVFIAFDLLYVGSAAITHWPLLERKAALAEVVTENQRLVLSRFTSGQGQALFRLAQEQELEGIVAKRKDSRYYLGRRSKDWLKIKYLKDEDYVICGYLQKNKEMTSLVLGQYVHGQLTYQGHVTLGVSGEALRFIKALPHAPAHPFDEQPPGHEKATWLYPNHVGIVEYMPRGEIKSQPVFKGLRNDKAPQDCRLEK